MRVKTTVQYQCVILSFIVKVYGYGVWFEQTEPISQMFKPMKIK